VKLAGGRVLVTGASRGIGESMARELARRGSSVALVARSEGPLKELASELGGIAYPADLSDPAQVDGLFARVEEDGPVDVLVNNAGLDEVGWFPEMAFDRLAAAVQVNLTTPMALCRQAIPLMLERGRGHLVNVSSLAGVGAFPGLVAYSATKAGLSQFTAGLRADLKGLPVRTTLVELGPVPTEMTAGFDVHQPTIRSFRRFYRMQLLTDVSRELVARDVADAIEKDRKHVRHPKRAVLFPLTAEAPRRLVELLLTGVPHRQGKQGMRP
jgi:short-subunit dehydrogenase